MDRRLLMQLLSTLLFCPSVSANAALSMWPIMGIGFIFLLIVTSVEGIFAYYLIQRFLGFKIRFRVSMLMSLIANCFSLLAGFFIVRLANDFFSSITNPIILLILFYTLTLVAETPIIWRFIRKKTRRPLSHSTIISFTLNAVSYLLLFTIPVILWVMSKMGWYGP